MSTLEDPIEQLKSLAVKAVSPDGSVTARFGMSSGLALYLSPDAVDQHVEDSLAEQITAAVAAIQKCCDRGVNKVTDTFAADNAWSVLDTDDPTQRIRRSARAIVVSATSPSGCVRVELTGDNGLRFMIASGTLRRLDLPPTALAAEAVQAYQAAQSKYIIRVRAIRQHPPATIGRSSA